MSFKKWFCCYEWWVMLNFNFSFTSLITATGSTLVCCQHALNSIFLSHWTCPILLCPLCGHMRYDLCTNLWLIEGVKAFVVEQTSHPWTSQLMFLTWHCKYESTHCHSCVHSDHNVLDSVCEDIFYPNSYSLVISRLKIRIRTSHTQDSTSFYF